MLVAATIMLPAIALGQNSSLNTFSPYTFYGIGDISNQGNTVLRSMGGIGIGYRNGLMVNGLNPASYSSVGPNAFLLNFEMEGQNFYSSALDGDKTIKTSFNTFNVRDIAVKFPLWKRMGLSINVTPYSSVGYRVSTLEQKDDILANLGQVQYNYAGDGGITQFKIGVGYEIFKNFSIGAELLYYHGNIQRDYSATPIVITGGGSFQTMAGRDIETISSFYGNFGLQWVAISTQKTHFTIGATYQMGGRMRGEVDRYIPVNTTLAPGESVINKILPSSLEMPATYGIGVFLHKPKFGIGVDYLFADWGNRNAGDVTDNMKFRNTHTVKVGGQFTPNPGDVRSVFRRWTYRAGFRYDQYYIMLNNQPVNDMAFTLGLGIPLRMKGLSNINVGVELGQRGTTQNNMIKEKYFKFSIGFDLFGEDYWFVKFKYD